MHIPAITAPLTINIKIFRIIYAVIIFSLCVVSFVYLGFGRTIAGLITYAVLFGFAFEVKFAKFEQPVSKKDRKGMAIILAVQAAVLLSLVYFNYAMVFLSRDGIEKEGVITSLKTEYKLEGGGQNAYLVTEYYCTVNTYQGKIQCTKKEKIGDRVFYLYSPKLPNTPPILHREKKARNEVIVDHGGAVFFGSFLFVLSLLLVWFFSMFKKGLPLLEMKIAQEAELEIQKDVQAGKDESFSRQQPRVILRLIYTVFYLISFSVVVLFVLALLKNLYVNIPFKFWSIGLTTLALITILITNWGEKLFEFSNNIMFSLKHYKFLSYLQQILKIIAFISFGKILFDSFTHADRSFLDAIIEFTGKFFDMDFGDIKQLLNR